MIKTVFLIVNLLWSGRISLPDSENLDSIAAEEDCIENKSLTTMPNILNLKRFVFQYSNISCLLEQLNYSLRS